MVPSSWTRIERAEGEQPELWGSFTAPWSLGRLAVGAGDASGGPESDHRYWSVAWAFVVLAATSSLRDEALP
eukprot:834795-Lingulodinium_polyedra.AAC.1